MKRSLVLSTALVALLAGSTAVSAEEMTGKIKTVSSIDDVISLENGPTFFLAEGASLKGLKPGETVKITYEVQADVKIATRITRVGAK